MKLFLTMGHSGLRKKKMGELFAVESHTITYHLKEIYKSGELQEDSTTRKIRVVQNLLTVKRNNMVLPDPQ